MHDRGAILVTRPAGQGEMLCAALTKSGYTAHHQPLLELLALSPNNSQCAIQLDNIEKYQHIIFISSNAVRFGMERISVVWPGFPGQSRIYAIGDTTAKRLGSFGVDAITSGAAMTSESLLAVDPLREITGHRVLIVKGEGGRTHLREALCQRGAKVDELCCYQRKCPPLSSGELAHKIASWQIDLILISSGEGLCNLLTLLSPTETIKLCKVPLVVPSKRVAIMAEKAGFISVYTADNASNFAMLKMLEQSNLLLENNT